MTHPEPRVEWEVVLGDKPGLWYKLKHNGKTEKMGCPDNLKELGRYLTRVLNDSLSHSLQEAKAERDREWAKAMGEMEDVGKGNKYNPASGMKCRNCFRGDILKRLGCEFEWQQVLGKTTNEKYGRKMIPIANLLSTLNTKETK